MSAVLQPTPPQANEDQDGQPNDVASVPPLHAVEPGETAPTPPRRAPRTDLPGSTRRPGRSLSRKLAILAGLGALLSLGLLGYHQLKKHGSNALADPVTPSAMPAPASADINKPTRPAIATVAEPTGAAPAASSLMPPPAASSTALTATPSAPAPAPAADAPVLSLPALAQAQAAQVGINASLSAGLAEVQRDLGELRLAVDGLVKAGQLKAAAPARVAHAKPSKSTPVVETPQARGAVLAVDLWDGRPSVVVGTGQTQDRRVLFLHEGDSKNGVTLKRASLSGQSAVFDVGGQETTLRVDGRE